MMPVTVLVLAIAALALAACSGGPGRTTASPTAGVQTAGPTIPVGLPTATPPRATATSQAVKPEVLVVANTDREGVNLRSEPGTGSTTIKAWPEGTEMQVAGPDRQVDGAIWKNIRDPDGNVGWAIGRYLVPRSAYTPAPQPTAAPPTPTVAAPAPTRTTAQPTATPAPTGQLALEVTLGSPTVSGGTQSLTVIARRDGRPVQGARVTLVVQYPTTMRTYNAPDTGPDGKSTYSWQIVDGKGKATVIVDVSAGDQKASTRAEFNIQ